MSWFYYERAAPRRTHDGIRLQSARGPVGSTWWGKRWVEALESICDSGRLSRGKSYARQGQVLSIEIEAGKVMAKVQGSRSTPYRVEIKLPKLEPEQWQAILTALEASPLPLARMLAGEMPPELEAIFKASGQRLFLQQRSDLRTDCSCPDWSDPCKHIAAVYYLLAEQFDADPFLLLKLRGMDRESLLARLAQASDSAADENERPEPLPLDPVLFWQGSAWPEAEALPAAADPGALLRRLKSPAMWRGQTPFLAAVEPVYPLAADTARAALAGEALPEAPARPATAKQVAKPVLKSAPNKQTAKAAPKPKKARKPDPGLALILEARRGDVAPEIWAEESTPQIESLADATLLDLMVEEKWQEVVNLAHAASRPGIAALALIELGEAEDAVELLIDASEPDINLNAICARLTAAGRLDLVLRLVPKATQKRKQAPRLEA